MFGGVAQFEFIELCQVFPFGVLGIDFGEGFDGRAVRGAIVGSIAQDVDSVVFAVDFVAHDAGNRVEQLGSLPGRRRAFQTARIDAQHIFDAPCVGQYLDERIQEKEIGRRRRRILQDFCGAIGVAAFKLRDIGGQGAIEIGARGVFELIGGL